MNCCRRAQIAYKSGFCNGGQVGCRGSHVPATHPPARMINARTAAQATVAATVRRIGGVNPSSRSEGLRRNTQNNIHAAATRLQISLVVFSVHSAASMKA